MGNYTKSLERAQALTKTWKCLSVVTQHPVKPLIVSLYLVVLQLVILISVFLAVRILNFQLNRPGPAVLNACYSFFFER